MNCRICKRTLIKCLKPQIVRSYRHKYWRCLIVMFSSVLAKFKVLDECPITMSCILQPLCHASLQNGILHMNNFRHNFHIRENEVSWHVYDLVLNFRDQESLMRLLVSIYLNIFMFKTWGLLGPVNGIKYGMRGIQWYYCFSVSVLKIVFSVCSAGNSCTVDVSVCQIQS